MKSADRQHARRTASHGAGVVTRWRRAIAARIAGADRGPLGQTAILDSIVESAPDGLLVIDAGGHIVLMSRAAREILGHDLVGRTVTECREHLDMRLDEEGTPCPEHELPALRALRGEMVNESELYLPECGARGAIWIRCRARGIRDERGGVLGAVVAFADVTRRKRVETALIEQKAAQQRGVHRQSALAEVELAVNEPHELVTVLDRAIELTERLLPSARASLVLCDDDLRRMVLDAADVAGTSSRALAEIISRDGGASRWIIENRRVLTVSDIRDDPFQTRPTDEDVQLGAYAGTPMIADDRVLGVLYALDNDTRIYTQDDLDFLDALANRAAAAIVKVRLYQELSELNRSLQWQTAQLREKEQRFRTLADTAPVLIWMSGPDKRCTWLNRTWLEFTGRTMEQELGRGWCEGIHPDDVARCLETYETAFDARNRFHMECRLRRKDGMYAWVLYIGIPRTDENGEFLGYMGSCVDITYRKEAQIELERQVAEQLRQLRVADRLASIGTLTAGLGHDMNNVLFPVRCRLDALEWTTVPAELRELLRSIVQSVEYLQQLSSGLRLCALDAEDENASGRLTHLASWWSLVRPLITHAVADRAELDVWLPEDLPPVAVAPHRLTQAVLNLVVNSADAMPEGGVIRIAARYDEREDLVEVAVRDEGEGMTPEVKAQVLDPFYTTKPRRLSTGLGLSLVRGVVVSCGGTIDIDSQPGEGTTVTLGLPALDRGHAPGVDLARDPAVISLEDPRTTAWVMSLLRSAGYAPRAGSAPDGARLWITDSTPDRIQAARTYLAGDERRRVIVIGSNGGAWETTGALVVADAGRLDSIRAAIDEIKGGLRGTRT